MRAVILGSGSAVPDPVRGNPSQAVDVGGEVLLFDCGERTTVNLVRAGINPIDINHLFFTHLHWDHIVDYNYLLMTTWNCGKTSTLNVYGPAGTQEMSDAFLTAHAVDVEFVKRFVDQLPSHITARPAPTPNVRVRRVQPGVVLETDSFRVTAGVVQHLNLLGFDDSTYAYRVDSDEGSVAISGDTVPCDQMIELAKEVDLLIHECAFLEEIITERDCWTGHSGPKGAARVAQRAGAKKLVLTHLGPYDSCPAAIAMASMYYGPRRGPGIWSQIIREAASEYAGPIVLAEDAMSFEIGQRH